MKNFDSQYYYLFSAVYCCASLTILYLKMVVLGKQILAFLRPTLSVQSLAVFYPANQFILVILFSEKIASHF